MCVANLHASAGLPETAAGEVLRRGRARASSGRAATRSCFGGDLNLRPARDPQAFAELRERFGLGEPDRTRRDRPSARPRARGGRSGRAGSRRSERELTEPDGLRLRLSDHAPVSARFREIVPSSGK